jgi:hypothetical protein
MLAPNPMDYAAVRAARVAYDFRINGSHLRGDFLAIKRGTLSVLLLLATLTQCGCSTRLAYDVGQALQRGQCERRPDEDARAQCVDSTSTSYDSYKRQTEATMGN